MMKSWRYLCVGIGLVSYACGSQNKARPSGEPSRPPISGPAADATPNPDPAGIPAPPAGAGGRDGVDSGPLQVLFQAKVGAEDLRCSARNPAETERRQVFTDLRLFISNLALVDASGQSYPLELDQLADASNLQYRDSQGQQIALLNFLEPGCASSDGTATVKNSVTGQLPRGRYTALRFQLGLPYAAYADELTQMPASLAPSDMGWMWEHLPADLQLEVVSGASKKMFNILISKDKTTITLPLLYIHEAGGAASLQVDMDLAQLFVDGDAEAFVRSLESACFNSNRPLNEAAPYCAHAYKALGLPVLNPKTPYQQTVFAVR